MNDSTRNGFLLRGSVASEERTFLLPSGLCRLGRSAGNDIELTVPGVSKHHALLRPEDGRLLAEDLLSKNGTFVNGERVHRRLLEPGDLLRLGPVELRLERPAAADRLAIALDAAEEPSPFPPPGRDTTAPLARPLRSALDLAPALAGCLPPGFLPGRSAPMVALFQRLAALAPSDLPLLIVGETGVGKEGVARTAHAGSRRARGPFVALNCAAIPGELLEAELFGIRSGVATGVAARGGRILDARGGTLFLDEVAELPLGLQAKLLRLLQEREVQPVGGQAQPVDLRVVAATNGDLDHLLEAGRFRPDLYYRLAGSLLRVPPLRERAEDLPELIAHFLRRFGRDMGRTVRGVSEGALRRLRAYSWPGNVRELENEMRRLACWCRSNEVITEELLALGGLEPHTCLGESPLDLASLEQRALREALARSSNDKTRAARLLGISRHALRRRLERYGGGAS
ncbi:MAG TPA: sigma 54-interacting transcriptional regulator [Thermoanaerobaculia bacterium]|nr:sigma 54-interacting transcriptional regulator [Thermoanaerobaculia bacterium]